VLILKNERIGFIPFQNAPAIAVCGAELLLRGYECGAVKIL
jgi:hypothetical protein